MDQSQITALAVAIATAINEALPAIVARAVADAAGRGTPRLSEQSRYGARHLPLYGLAEQSRRSEPPPRPTSDAAADRAARRRWLHSP